MATKLPPIQDNPSSSSRTTGSSASRSLSKGKGGKWQKPDNGKYSSIIKQLAAPLAAANSKKPFVKKIGNSGRKGLPLPKHGEGEST